MVADRTSAVAPKSFHDRLRDWHRPMSPWQINLDNLSRTAADGMRAHETPDASSQDDLSRTRASDCRA